MTDDRRKKRSNNAINVSAILGKTGVSLMLCEPWFGVVRTEKSGRDLCLLRSCHPSEFADVQSLLRPDRVQRPIRVCLLVQNLDPFEDSSCGHMRRDGLFCFLDPLVDLIGFLHVTSHFLLCVCSSAFFS